MLTKKLKKIEKACRKADAPVLLALSTHIDHVVNYLEIAKEDDSKVTDYGNALAQLDLSSVVKAHEALTAAKPNTETAADEAAEHPMKNGKKKDKKKEEKKKKKADDDPVVADPAIAQEADKPADPVVESSNGAEKKNKKAKKKGK